MGIMQIPEEQRNNVRNHAATSLEKAREIACDLSDSMSSNCARYTGTDPHEVVGRVVPDEIMSCCYSVGGGEDGNNTFRGERGRGGHPHRGGVMEGYDGHSLPGGGMDHGYNANGGGINAFEIRSEGSSPIANAVNGVERGVNRLVGDVFGDEHPSPVSQSVGGVGDHARGGGGGHARGGGNGGGGGGEQHHAGENEDATGRRVACGRKGERKGQEAYIQNMLLERVDISFIVCGELIHDSFP